MGLHLIVKDELWFPTEYGLNVGDNLDIVLVAGGNGNCFQTLDAFYNGYPGSDTLFGKYEIAKSGLGSIGGGVTTGSSGWPCGGGGGYIPGSSFQGGNGIRANAPGGTGSATVLVNTNAGGGGTGSGFIGAGGICFGGGNVTATSSHLGTGGGGYGAGAGTNPYYNSSASSNYYAGNAGQIVYASHKITQEDVLSGIPVQIGSGGNQFRRFARVCAPNGQTDSRKIALTFSPTYISYCQKTFETIDGTYGLHTGSNADSSDATTYVKFMNIDAILPFSSSFPGFSASVMKYPIYLCNGYYVQIQKDNNKIYWVLASSSKAGSVASGEYGNITMSLSTNTYGVGFTATSLVVMSGATEYHLYSNWTPNFVQATFETKTIATALGATDTKTYLVPYDSDESLYPQVFIDTATATGTLTCPAIKNVSTAEQYTSASMTLNAYYYIGKTGATIASSTTSYGLYRIKNSTSTSANMTAFGFGGTSAITLYSGNSSCCGPVLPAYNNNVLGIVTADRGFSNTYIDNLPGVISMLSSGYNNIKGCDETSYYYRYNGTDVSFFSLGGAGGCCMITW